MSAPEDRQGTAASAGSSAVRDLLVTAHTPVLRSGRAMRTYGVARALAAHRGLDLLYVRFGAHTPDAPFRSIPNLELHEVVPSRGFARARCYVRARTIWGAPPALARGVSAELISEASSLAAMPSRGRVIADGPTAAAALIGLARLQPVIYNAHNLESGFRHELRGSSHMRALRAFEAHVLDVFAESWMVSEADIVAARALSPSATLRCVPNAIDVTAIKAPLHDGPKASHQPRALFVASFHYEPNRTGLRFLLDGVMPIVWSQLPQATLTVIGAGLSKTPSDDPRVHAPGFVGNLSAAYAEADCVVVPLLNGGGTPLKLIEALGHRMPTIATPRAVAGLDLIDGEHCLVAESAEAFADAMLRALTGHATAIGERGRRLVEQRYSIAALAAILAP